MEYDRRAVSQRSDYVALPVTPAVAARSIDPTHPLSESAAPDSSGPAYVLGMDIEGVRCFKRRQSLDLTDDDGRPALWTVILGDNGTGKTTLLQSLVYGMAASTAGSASYRAAHTWGDGLARSGTRAFWGWELTPVESLGQQRPPVARLTAVTDGRGVSFDLPPGGRVAPLVVAYGAARHIGPSSLTPDESDDPTATLLAADTPLLNAEEWLLRLDYRASRSTGELARRQRERVRQLLIALLPDVEEIHIEPPRGNGGEGPVRFRTPYGEVRLSELGLGYQCTIGWMVDLASRLYARYPESDDPLGEPAVVLVDEIDLHLHPRWQRDLVALVSSRFPAVQFIFTAHSPLVVQSAEGANLATLRRDKDTVVIDNDPVAATGWRIDQLLTSDLFGLRSARGPRVERLLDERARLLAKPAPSAAERARLREIEAELEPLPTASLPEDQEAMDIIRRAASRLRQSADAT